MTPIYCSECGDQGSLEAGEATLPCGHSKGFYVPTDGRTPGEKKAWGLLGPPLYYCEHCLRQVKVTAGDDPQVIRSCAHNEARVIAPRRSILAGKGGLSFTNKVKMLGMQIAATLTGRCV